MKIISFSLWGKKSMYYVGALENIRLAKELYPDWKCRFYIDESVDSSFSDELGFKGAEVVLIPSKPDSPFFGMFWRFFPIDEPSVDLMISRDCDSRLSIREKLAVDAWIASDKMFHTMHDHYAHRSVPILGGMWGAKKGCISSITEKISKWAIYTHKGIDQTFLTNVIWPEVKAKTMSHSSIHNRWNTYIPFPEHAPCMVGYVGEIFDENNNRVVS